MPEPRRVAAIDCGTNSMRLLVADIQGRQKVDLVREMRVVRLGEGVDETGVLAPGAIERTITTTKEYFGIIEALGATTVRFCATSAVRDAANAEEFGDAIEQILGVRPEVLSGDAEARASFNGATREFGDGRTAVLDIGGGSTEVVLGNASSGRGDVEWAHSFDVGSVRLTERFLASDPPTIDEVTACSDHLDRLLAPRLADLAPAASFIGVAGTITTVAAHALGLDSYDHDAIHGARISLDDVRGACLSLMSMSVADRRALPFMHPGRADVIGAGAIVVERLIEHLPLDTTELIISESDILDGIAWAVAAEPLG